MDADDERDGLAPHAFCCPITQEEMVDPVVASDGHCYERAAIVEVPSAGAADVAQDGGRAHQRGARAQPQPPASDGGVA